MLCELSAISSWSLLDPEVEEARLGGGGTFSRARHSQLAMRLGSGLLATPLPPDAAH